MLRRVKHEKSFKPQHLVGYPQNSFSIQSTSWFLWLNGNKSEDIPCVPTINVMNKNIKSIKTFSNEIFNN